MMDKTININLAGTLFQIDEEAYRILHDYLQAINNRFRNVQGGLETIEDIESRIAEIFQSQKGLAGVITKENVEAMISIIGKPEDFDHTESEADSPVYTAQRKRMYRNPDDSIISGVCGGITGYNSSSKVGNAINEVFRAIGRVFYIALRIFLIIIGVAFVLTGFLAILSFVMVFVFKYPGAFPTDAFGMHMIYFPDFLNYIVNPAVAPWIIALTLITVALPMLALIYWGVKMIFWFRAKDGVFSLVGLVLWVMVIAALSMILFNEGISFAESARTSSQNIFSHSPDTLYIIADRKVSDLKFDKELSIRKEGYTVFINEEKKELYIRPYLDVNNSDDDVARVEVRKRSSGRSELDAMKKAEGLHYNYSLNGDTLVLDEYFTIPAGRKWSADDVHINLNIPEGTILKFDRASENLFHSHSDNEFEEDPGSTRWESGNRSWILTDDGLKVVSKHSSKQK